jgi:hypothetical protein
MDPPSWVIGDTQGVSEDRANKFLSDIILSVTLARGYDRFLRDATVVSRRR